MLSRRHLTLIALLSLTPGLVFAQSTNSKVSWANNGNNFGNATSWKDANGNATLPSTANVAAFDASVSSQPTITASQTVAGIEIADAAGNVTLTGNATLTVGNAGVANNSASNSQNIAAPLVFEGSDSSITNAGDLTIDGTITNNTTNGLKLGGGGANGKINGQINGAGRLIKSDSGKWRLSAANTYTGDTEVTGGTLQLGADGALPAGTSVELLPDAATTATLNLTSTNQSIGNLTLGGQAGTNANVSIDTGGSLAVNGNVVYDATNSPGSASIAGGSLALNGSRHFNVGQSSNSAGADLTISSAISGAGATLIKEGAGKLVLAGNNTYSGSTVVNDGRLQIASGGTHPSGGAVTVDEQTAGGTAAFDLGSTTQTIGMLTLRGAANSMNLVDLGPTGNLTLGGDVVYDATNQPGQGRIWNGTAVQLGAAQTTFTVDHSANAANGDLSIETPLAGAGGVTKAGSGTLVLGADNTYVGPTTVNTGTLQIGAGGTAGRVAGDINNNAQVVFKRSDASSYSHAISGTGSVVVDGNGSGVLTLAGNNTYSGSTTVQNGTLAISSEANVGGALASPNTGAVVLNAGTLEIAGNSAVGFGANRGVALSTGGGTIQTDAGATLNVAGAISGSSALNKSGAGTLELAGASTYTGQTQVQAGTLKDAAANAFSPASQIAVAAGATVSVNNNEAIAGLNDIANAGGSVALANAAHLVLNGNGIFSGAISGNGSLELASTNYTNQTLTGANTYTGGTKIGNGTTLQIGIGADKVGGTTGSITPGNITNNGSLVFMRSDSIHYGGISGSGIVSQDGAGTLTLDGGNTYSGGTFIEAGTVTDATAGALPNGGDVYMSGGVLNIAHNETIGGLGDSTSAPNTAAVALATGAKLTLSNRGSMFSGNITGGGALQVANGAYETITGTAAHTGGTTIGNSSTLEIGNGGTTGSLAGSIINNGQLMFNRSDAVTYGGITGSGSLTQTGNGTLTLSGANSYFGQTVINAGTLADANAGAFSPGSVIRLYGNGATLNVNATESIAGLGGYYLAGNSTVNLNSALTIAGQGETYGGTLAGNGSLTIATGAHQTLAGNVGHTGGTTIASGASLQFGDGSTAGSVAGDITDNGSLTFSPAGTVTYAGKVTGGGSLNLSNTGGTIRLTGQNTYSGSTYIGSGTLQVAATNALPTATNVSIFNGRLDLASDQTVAQLSGSSGAAVNLGGNYTLNVAPSVGAHGGRFEGAITGNGTLAFSGATGTSLSLDNGGSTFSGGTQIRSGRVYVGASGALGSGPVSVSSGASLMLGNSDSSSVSLANSLALANDVTVGGGTSDYGLVFSGPVAVASGTPAVHLSQTVQFSGNLKAASGSSSLTFDSAAGGFGRGILLGTVDASVSSITANNAGVIFGSASATPAAGLSVGATNGYIGVGATPGYTTPTVASVLNLITNKGGFGGTIGFDSVASYGAPHVFSDAIDLSTFGSGTTLGSSTAAVLNGTLTPGANGYAFGNGGGVLVVQSALGGGNVNVSSNTSIAGNALTAVFQGANSFHGQMAVANSVAVLDSATALPSGATVNLGANGYLGYTEAFTPVTKFSDFVAHLPAGTYTSSSILGLDSHTYIANALATGNPSGSRYVSESLDLSGLSSVYLGTTTGAVVAGTIKAPNQNGAARTLSLLAADDATLTISAALTSNNVSSVVVGSGAAFANGTVLLQGYNTYTGGTTLRSGTLLLQQSSYKPQGGIVAGPLGTGTLTVNPAGSKQPILAANGYITIDNSVALAGTVQLGTPNSGYYTESSTTTGTAALSEYSYGQLILNGVISDVGAAHGALVVSGPTELNGANTFTGGVTIQGDELGLGNDAALGTGPVTISSLDGHVDLYSYYGARTLSNAVTVSGSSQNVYFGGNFTLNGSLALNAPLAVSVDGPDVLHLNGPLSGTGSFTTNYGTVMLAPGAPTTSTGGFVANDGAIIFGNANALPAQPTANAFTASSSGYIGIGFVPADVQNGFVNRFNKGPTSGAIGFDSASSASPNTFNTPIDLTGFQSSARLGSATAAILGANATITPQDTAYNFGNGGGLLRVDSALTDAPSNATYPGSRNVNVDSSYNVPLTVRLTGANTYSGGTIINNSAVIFGTGALPAQGEIDGEDGYAGTEDPALIASPGTFINRFNPDVYSMIVGFDSATGSSVTVASDLSLANFTDDVFLGTSTNALIAGNITLPTGQTAYNFAGFKGGQLSVATGLTGANSVTIGQDYNDATFMNPTVAGSKLSRVTLTGANSYTGGTYLNAGELFVGNQHALGTGALNVSGSTAPDGRHLGFSSTTSGITLPNPIALTWAQLDVGAGDTTFGLSGSVSGQSGSGLYKVGTGALTLSGDNSGFNGDVVIQGGSVIFAPSATGNSFGNGTLTFDSPSAVGATFQDNATVNGLQDYHGTGTITLTAGKTFAINQTSDGEFGGTIAGSTAGLTLTGTGYHLVLSGTNTYAGPTTVQGNVTVVSGSSNAFGAATNAVTLNGGKIVLEPGVTISNPLTLTAGTLAGAGTFAGGNVTVGTDVGLAPGTRDAVGTLRFANSLTFASGGAMQLRLADVGATSGGWDQVQVGGTLAITATAAAPFTLKVVPFTAGGLLASTLPANFNPYAAGSWLVVSANSIPSFNANQFTIDASAFSGSLMGGTFSLAMNAANNGLMLNFTPVPEPSTYALMLAGLGTVLFVSRRRRRRD